MTRSTRFLACSSVVTAVYFILFLSVIPVPLLSKETADQLLPVIPWWLLVSFGSYSLGSLGWGVLTIRDCTDAYNELLSDINQAKNELRAKGVSVD